MTVSNSSRKAFILDSIFKLVLLMFLKYFKKVAIYINISILAKPTGEPVYWNENHVVPFQ